MGTAKLDHYVIRGGSKGHERLKVLARVMHPTTAALFDRVGISTGLYCLDVGCGSGDVSMEIARRVGPTGRVVGADIDEIKLGLARAEAQQAGVNNVEFRFFDIRDQSKRPEFDLVYTRFLLTHLNDPAGALNSLRQLLKKGGAIIVEDIDISGCFVHPPSRAFDRYCELYCAAVLKRGGDPNIGPRLPLLLKQAGFKEIGVSVVQPMAMEGEIKVLGGALTLENIGEAAIAEGLTTNEEVNSLVKELYEFAEDPDTLMGAPRIVQTWGSNA